MLKYWCFWQILLVRKTWKTYPALQVWGSFWKCHLQTETWKLFQSFHNLQWSWRPYFLSKLWWSMFGRIIRHHCTGDWIVTDVEGSNIDSDKSVGREEQQVFLHNIEISHIFICCYVLGRAGQGADTIWSTHGFCCVSHCDWYSSL